MAATDPPAGDAPAEPVEKRDTKRVVLRRASVVELPDDITEAQLDNIAGALGLKGGKRAKKLVPVPGWFVVPGEFEGASKEKSIYAYTGPPGQPDTIVGAFKAVPTTAWKDGVLNAAPPKPLVQSTKLED